MDLAWLTAQRRAGGGSLERQERAARRNGPRLPCVFASMMGGALFPFAASANAVPPLSAGVDGRNAAVDPARALAACDTAMARYAAGDEAAFAVVYDELA